MPKYRLLVEHVTSDGRVLPPGTEIGDGTPEPWPLDPSPWMEPLDEEGERRIKAIFDRTGDTVGWEAWKRRHDARKAAAEAAPDETDGEPVSEQQAREREGKQPLTVSPPPQRPQPSPTRATPQARPAKPNEEQYPKD
jgi:hypothetical protein